MSQVGESRREPARGRGRKQVRPKPRLGIDGQGFRNGHDQMAVAGGIDRGMVNVVTEDHKKASLQCFFDLQTPNADRSNGR